MTNPNNAVGTNAAYSGRTSVNAFNDDLAAYSRGVLSGWACSPSTGLKVQLGGSGITRDVAVAVDNAGNRTTINNISGSPIEMTISAAPSTNSRIDAIVAYVDNPAEGVSTVADNPAACGMIVVKGTAAASPVEPNESTIRAAITADGASGVTAYYAILATVTIASGTTDLTSDNITLGNPAGIMAKNIDYTTFQSERLTFASKDITGSDTDLVSYTVLEDGIYLVTAAICLQRNGGGDVEFLIWAKQNGTNKGNIGGKVKDDGGRTPVSNSWALPAKKGDILKVGGTSVYGNIWANNDFSTIYVCRIA